MATTTFTNGVTLSDAGWFNGVDAVTYDGATTQVLVGGGAGVLAVWTTGTGTGAPVRAGAPTFTSNITFSAASAKIIPGATNFSHRNNADSADNLLISDAGLVTVRAGVVVTAGGITDLAGETRFSSATAANVSGTNAARIWKDTSTTKLDFGKSGAGAVTCMSFYYTGTERGSIAFDDTSTAFNTTSDKDMKIDRGVAAKPTYIQNLVIHDFEWKLASGKLGRGVFAQDAYKVFPDSVTVGNDADLNDDGTKKKPWSVDYSKYVPDLIVGWQNHEARLAAIEAKVEAQ